MQIGWDVIIVTTNQQAASAAGAGGQGLAALGRDGGCCLPRADPGLRQPTNAITTARA